MTDADRLDEVLEEIDHTLLYHRHDCTYKPPPHKCNCGILGIYQLLNRLREGVERSQDVVAAAKQWVRNHHVGRDQPCDCILCKPLRRLERRTE